MYKYGADFYHGNSISLFRNALANADYSFIILKASEGKTFKDSLFSERAQDVLNTSKYLGTYHYARPENGNTAVEEAENFCKQLSHTGGRCRPFLDVEGAAVNYAAWVREFLEEMVKRGWKNVGVYCSLSVAQNQLKDIVKDYPLWVAHYHKDDKMGCGHIAGEIITQYTSSPYDMDVWDTDVLPESEWYMTQEGSGGLLKLTDGEEKLIRALREQGVKL